MANDANQLVELIRELVRAEAEKQDCTVKCIVQAVNPDKTIDAFLVTDLEQTQNTLLRGLTNMSRYNFVKGDIAILYKMQNNINNSFIIGKIGRGDDAFDALATRMDQLSLGAGGGEIVISGSGGGGGGGQTNNKFTGKNAFTQPIIFGPHADTAISAMTGAASLKYVEDGDGKIILGKGWVNRGDPSTGTYYTFSKSGTGTYEVATVDDITAAVTGKQDKLTPGRNIEITGTTIQTTKELDASKISNSSGGLTVGKGSSTVDVYASGISLSATSYVNINANTATINAPGGVSVTGKVAMADSLSVTGAITTASNNPASTTLKEVVVDTDYVIIDGGDSTTTW